MHFHPTLYNIMIGFFFQFRSDQFQERVLQSHFPHCERIENVENDINSAWSKKY